MRRLLPPGLFLLAAMSTAAIPVDAASGESQTTLQWRVSLDEHGKVSALEPVGEGVQPLRERLEPLVRDWEFVSGTLAGLPKPTQTLLSVQLGLTPSADGNAFGVRIRNARTGGSVADSSVAPRFPRSMLGRVIRDAESFRALVLVEVRYDAAGNAISVVPSASSPIVDGPFVESVIKATRRWKYQPEMVAGTGLPGTLLVPVCFTIATDATMARRQSAPCHWTQPGSGISLSGGDSLALDSSVRLKTEIVDRVL